VGGDARAGRSLELHPEDRVHRIGQAAPDRRNEGCGRRRQACPARDRSARPVAESQEPQAAAEGRGPQEHPPPDQGSEAQAQGDDRHPRAGARRAQEDPGHDYPRRVAGRAGQEGAGRGEPPAGRLDCEEVHQSRAAVSRPHSGRQHRPDEGSRQVRVPPRATSSRPTPRGGSARRLPARSPIRRGPSASQCT